MNDFEPQEIVKLKEGDAEKAFPLYDLNQLRAGVLFTDDYPPEIRDQIKQNCERVKTRLFRSEVTTEEPVAIVGYGPTLKRFWPHIRKFKTIISTSGAHKFLVDRDIIPTYHVDVDFRARKAVHTKESHPDVEYLFSSLVHPDTLQNADGKRCKLWHCEIKDMSYPEGELVVPAYWDVGQEAVLIAQILGYSNLHLFGYDYSYEVNSAATHAGFHNGDHPDKVVAKVGTKFFPTSDSLARGVMVFTKLMEDNPNLNLTIYSDGLLAAYLQHHYKDHQNA